ncbi:MAG: hypothetical protein L7V86_24180 [Verrucomicrobiales bacterium]|nr:hypothetical protein [Verrucomicrobiales bacterium]MDF1786089.1 hypothetical protein [Verrucomicrobiales bacterium]
MTDDGERISTLDRNLGPRSGSIQEALGREATFGNGLCAQLAMELEVKDSYPDLSRPIQCCSFSRREPLLEVLLDFPVDLEAIAFEENKGLTTALVLAAWRDSLTSCCLLLEAGVNLTKPARPQKARFTPQPSITPGTKWTCFSPTVPNTMSSPR